MALNLSFVMARVSWVDHPLHRGHQAGLSKLAGSGILIGFVNDHDGQPAGVVAIKGDFITIRLSELHYDE